MMKYIPSGLLGGSCGLLLLVNMELRFLGYLKDMIHLTFLNDFLNVCLNRVQGNDVYLLGFSLFILVFSISMTSLSNTFLKNSISCLKAHNHLLAKF